MDQKEKNCVVLSLSEIGRNGSQRQIWRTKNKGYYLFLGASKDKGKHHDKICQRSFVCKHKPHDKYPIKKHNLVCHEHRNDTNVQNFARNTKTGS